MPVKPFLFTRIMRGPGLRLDEEMKVDTVGGAEMFYYRSRWDKIWTRWGYWNTFPKGTTAEEAITFLQNAGWKLKS